MKNICLILILNTSLLLISCGKRDYSCQCEGGLLGGATITIKESTRRQAEKECARHNSLDGGAADGYFNCKLK